MSNKVYRLVTDQIMKQMKQVDPSDYSAPRFFVSGIPPLIREAQHTGESTKFCFQIPAMPRISGPPTSNDRNTIAKLPWTDLFIARGHGLAAFGRGDRDKETTG